MRPGPGKYIVPLRRGPLPLLAEIPGYGPGRRALAARAMKTGVAKVAILSQFEDHLY